LTSNDENVKNKIFKFILIAFIPPHTPSKQQQQQEKDTMSSDQTINLFSNLLANLPNNNKHKPAQKRKFDSKIFDEKNTNDTNTIEEEKHQETFRNLVKKKVDDVRKNTMDKI
jgi:hypothetical protein